MKHIPQNVLEHYRKLKLDSTVENYFIADSSRVVLKLLKTKLLIQSLLVTEKWAQQYSTELTNLPPEMIFHATLVEMQSIVGFTLHQGVMARAQRPADVPLLDLLPGPILVMDGIAKTDNVGAIIRNAAAFGVNNILIDARTCHPYQRRAVRTSMGNVFGMKIHQTHDLPQALRELKIHGMTIYAFENRPHAVELGSVTFASSAAVIIGSEASGISPEVLAASHMCVKIPIDDEVYALNAACASAVALYALAIRR